jgi:hypothetical protein
MREHPVKSLGPLKLSLFGKIQDKGQSAGNSIVSSSETKCEAFISKKSFFKILFICFFVGCGYFIIV